MNKKIILPLLVTLALLVPVLAAEVSYLKISGYGGDVTELNEIDYITDFRGIEAEKLNPSLTGGFYTSRYSGRQYGEIRLTLTQGSYWSRYSKKIYVYLDTKNLVVEEDNGKTTLTSTGRYKVNAYITYKKFVCRYGRCYWKETISSSYSDRLDEIVIEIENGEATITATDDIDEEENTATTFVKVEGMDISQLTIQ